MTTPPKHKNPHPEPSQVTPTDSPDDLTVSFPSEEYQHQMEEHTSKTPALSGGDADAEQSGEEAVGGTVATPDQDVVEEIGKAVGITYNDDEPLDTEEKLRRRDAHHWELNPASAEDNEEPVTWDEFEDSFDIEETVSEDEK